MPLSDATRRRAEELLLEKIRAKLRNYSPETASMPFHDRLLGRSNRAIFSFVQSMNTSLGQSVFEEVAALIGGQRFRHAEHQYRGLKGYLSEGAISEISHILDDLANERVAPDRDDETRRVAMKSTEGVLGEERNPRVDLFLVDAQGCEYYVDIKTAKPNINEFRGFKRVLLEWVGIRKSLAKDVEVKTLVAIPYNPYAPRPYDRWTGRGLFDYGKELLVGDQFWDFLGGDGTYEDLLEVFEEVGRKLQFELSRLLEKLK